MTRLDDIRERAEADRELHWLKLRETQDDVFFLLDLVKRAEELIDNEGFDPWSVDVATQWLRDLRGE